MVLLPRCWALPVKEGAYGGGFGGCEVEGELALSRGSNNNNNCIRERDNISCENDEADLLTKRRQPEKEVDHLS